MLGARQELSQELGTAGEVEHCRVICSGDAREPHICKQTDFSCFKNISVLEECRSHDTAGTVCPRRYWDPRLSLCSLALQLTARKRNNQQTQKCLLVGRTTEEGRV